MRLTLLLALLLFFSLSGFASEKPRLIVLTDISSLTAGVREPDDGQSMIRLMLYSNDLDIEGLIATSNLRHGQVCQPELIREVISAYGEVRPNLLQHSAAYPPAEHLLSCVKTGQAIAGPGVPVTESIGDGKDTEGSGWIISVTDRPDPRPVWITIWGGSADLAQALWKVRQTRSEAAQRAFVAKLRVYSIYDQDSTGRWIRENFPGLFVITQKHGIRGMYRGGDASLVSSAWVEANIKNRGPLAALYPIYNGGDIWSKQLGPVRGSKEGDTPSFLHLLSNGLTDPEKPQWGSWGGRFQAATQQHFVDTKDDVPAAENDPDPHMSAVHRWRAAFQANFAARMEWCVKPYSEANHEPVAVINKDTGRSALMLKAAPGNPLPLDASASSDPDGQTLSFRWWIHRDAGSCKENVTIETANSARTTLHIPAKARAGETIHVILEAIDTGFPPLTSYRRLVVTVE